MHIVDLNYTGPTIDKISKEGGNLKVEDVIEIEAFSQAA